MESITYDNKKIAEILDEKHWKLLVGKSPGRVGGNLLQRYIDHKVDDFTHESWEKMELFVATWTSAKNYVNDASASSNTVVDPTVEAGKSVEKGTWYRGPLERQRVQGERNSAPVWRIIQTLFKGAADTESEFTSDDGCAYKVYRKYYIDQVSLPAIAASTSGVERSNNFQTDPVTGLHNGYQERRTRLHQSVPAFYTMQDAFEKAQLTRHLGVRDGDKDENGAAISPAIPDPTAQAAGTLVEVNRSKNSDCTQDVNVTTKTAIAQASAGTTDRKDKFETVAAVEARNAASAPVAPAQTDGVIVTTQDSLNAYAKHDTKIETRTALAVANAQLAKVYTPFEVRAEDTDRNSTAAATLPTDQTAGTIKTVEDATNDFGRHDIKTIERTAVAQASAEASDTRDAFETQTEVGAVNASAALTPVPQSAGTIVTAQSKLNDFARYDTSLKTRTSVAVPTAVESKQYAAYETRVDTVDRNTAADPTLPSSQTAGSIVTQQDTVNDFNVHDIQTTTRTAISQANAGASDVRTPFETVAVVEARNAANAITPVGQVAGTIKTVKDSLNDFARHDTALETRTAIPVAAAIESKVYTPFESRVTTVDRHTAADPALPTSQSAGTIVEMEDRVTDFNDHDVTTNTRTAIEQANAGAADRKTKFETVATVEARNATAAITPGAQADGSIVTVTDELNEFAKHNTRQETRVAVAHSQAAYVGEKDDYTETTITKLRNQNSAPAAAALGEAVDIDVNEFGRFDSVRRARAAAAGVIGMESPITWSIKGGYYFIQLYTQHTLTGPIYPYGPNQPVQSYSHHSSTVKMQRQTDYSMNFYATEALAYAGITNGNEGSHVNQVAPGVWRGVKATDNDQGIGTVETIADPFDDLVIDDKDGDGVPDA